MVLACPDRALASVHQAVARVRTQGGRVGTYYRGGGTGSLPGQTVLSQASPARPGQTQPGMPEPALDNQSQPETASAEIRFLSRDQAPLPRLVHS